MSIKDRIARLEGGGHQVCGTCGAVNGGTLPMTEHADDGTIISTNPCEECARIRAEVYPNEMQEVHICWGGLCNEDATKREED